LAGLRELPKFAWLFPLNEARRQLLLAGAELAERGVLNDANDILYLRVPEAEAAASGEDLTAVVQQRRAVHQRELRRRQVPGLLLSDGTVPELALESEELTEGTWQGMPGGPPAPLEWFTTRPRHASSRATSSLRPPRIPVGHRCS
jgi:rifampicin phosphotransferase